MLKRAGSFFIGEILLNFFGGIIIKIEVKDNVCIITINCKENILNCPAEITREATLRNINLLYTSALNFIGNCCNIVVAIDENDIYSFFALISCIKDNLKITSCTVNSSNTQITWDKLECNIYETTKKFNDKIRLIYESGEAGSIIFESDIKHKLISKLEAL